MRFSISLFAPAIALKVSLMRGCDAQRRQKLIAAVRAFAQAV